jgi:hypothetical protein
MKNKLLFIGLFIIFLLSINSVFAFNVEYSVLENKIMKDGKANFVISIKNTDLETDQYRISTSDYLWELSTDPLSDYYSGFYVAPETKKDIYLYLDPNENLYYDIYRVKIDVTSQISKKTVSLYLPIEIRSPFGSARKDYASMIITSGNVDKSNKMDPRNTGTLNINLRNGNMKNHTNISVDISSDFFSKQIPIELGSQQEISFTEKFQLDPLSKPDNKTITLTVLDDKDNPIPNSPYKFDLEILPYSNIKKTESANHKWLKYSKTIYVKNEGNIDNHETIKVETNSFSSLFTSTNPKAIVSNENGLKYYKWDISINPDGEFNIDITTNYRPIIYVILAIIIVTSLYYLLRSPIIVKKQAININLHEGGISEMKLLIHIKNRTPNIYSNLIVGERIPKIADYIPTESMGNILPSKVLRHEQKGTMLKWKIDNLEAFEERIVIYKIKSKLTILGKFIIPATIIKYRDEANSEYVTHSNKLKITNVGVSEDENQ